MLKKLLISAFSIIAIQATAQDLSNSPYSIYGVGDIIDPGFAQNYAMGGTGVAYNNANTINFSNPASYSVFKLTTFDAAASVGVVSFSDLTGSQKAATSSLAHLALGLPLWSGKIGMSLGLMPYSSSGYNLTSTENIDNVGAVIHTYQGTGGINQFYVGVGYKPAKWVSVGVNASYLFGSINRQRTVLFSQDSAGFIDTRAADAIHLGGLMFTYGVQFYADLPKDYKLTVGLSANLGTNISATDDQLITRYFYNGSLETLKDSLPTTGDSIGKIRIPANFKIGIAIKNSQWLIGLDAGYQQWTKFEILGTPDPNLKDSWFIASGAQFTPNDNALNSYSKLIQYRFGARYELTPIYLAGTQLTQRSISFGAGFPIVKPAIFGVSYINVGCQIGVLGQRSADLVKEDFVKFNASFSFSDKWFSRRKYD